MSSGGSMGATKKFIQNKGELSFVNYNPKDIVQNIFLRDIADDGEISRYISDIASDIINSTRFNTHTRGLLVRENKTGSYIGALTIKPSGYDLTAAPVEYAVHKRYRYSDKKYGSRILLNITDLLFMNRSISKIVLEIKRDNIASIKAAINADFAIDYDLAEQFYLEGYNYIPYSLNNRDYTYERNISRVKVK
jgi:RimJ/RimL family protein N-acetyltransferase